MILVTPNSWILLGVYTNDKAARISLIHYSSDIVIKQARLMVIKYTPLIKMDFRSKIYSWLIWVKD